MPLEVCADIPGKKAPTLSGSSDATMPNQGKNSSNTRSRGASCRHRPSRAKTWRISSISHPGIRSPNSAACSGPQPRSRSVCSSFAITSRRVSLPRVSLRCFSSRSCSSDTIPGVWAKLVSPGASSRLTSSSGGFNTSKIESGRRRVGGTPSSSGSTLRHKSCLATTRYPRAESRRFPNQATPPHSMRSRIRMGANTPPGARFSSPWSSRIDRMGLASCASEGFIIPGRLSI